MRLRSRIGLIAAVMLALSISAPALASLSQGFATKTSIATGSLVSLDPKATGTVVVTDLNNVANLFGVVVPPTSASISLSGSSGQVQVVTSGTANVLVSTSGGDIKVGDYITVSPIAGVGQKVGSSSTKVVGTAQTDFNGSGEGVTKRSIEDASGKKTEVSIGQIPVVIGVSTFTSTDGKQNYVVPNWLQNLSNTVAGKEVSPIRIIIAGIILLISLASVTVLLYSAVRNSIISIGRNPLSKNSVLGGLLQVIGIAGGILLLTAGAIYMVISR